MGSSHVISVLLDRYGAAHKSTYMYGCTLAGENRAERSSILPDVLRIKLGTLLQFVSGLAWHYDIMFHKSAVILLGVFELVLFVKHYM